jgi:hypothetical protein
MRSPEDLGDSTIKQYEVSLSLAPSSNGSRRLLPKSGILICVSAHLFLSTTVVKPILSLQPLQLTMWSVSFVPYP